MADINAALKAELEMLRAENAKLKKDAIGKVGKMKVSKKGAMSIYGMGRFPVTLYDSQWRLLLAPESVVDIFAFLDANAGSLRQKGDPMPVIDATEEAHTQVTA